jgi:hypothetical protein
MAKDRSILPLYMQERQAKCVELNKSYKSLGKVITSPLWSGSYELTLSDLTDAELRAMLNAFKSIRLLDKIEIDIPYLDIDGQPINE